MNKRETNLNEIKRIIDYKIENEYLDFYLAEGEQKLIQWVVVYEDLRDFFGYDIRSFKECFKGFIYEEEDIEEKEIFEALDLDEVFDEIYLYYVQKLCEYLNLDYKLAQNREDYIVFPKSDSKK